MKINLYVQYEEKLTGYWEINKNCHNEKLSLLSLLFLSFNKYRDWISTEEKDDNVYIWINLDEDDYNTWEAIPKLMLSKGNYEEIFNIWNENAKNPKRYLVFTQDINNTITLAAKDELSQQDLERVELDKKSQERWSNG